MDENTNFFVGLDVHKETISISVCEAGREASQFRGTIRHDVPALLKVLRKLGAPATQLVAYEAGPTGYGLYRRLVEQGYACQVVAPSLIPQRAAERIKTDRRDSARLAELLRAGELTPIWVPDVEHEALRNLWRAREDAMHMRLQARQQLKAFLLRHGRNRLGWLAAAAGVAIAVGAWRRFRQVGTTVNPLDPSKASRLVTDGVFRVSRNPMYLGLVLLLIGWAIGLGSASPWLVPPLFVIVLTVVQIIPEEQALSRRFGEQYLSYRRSVARWIGRVR